MKLLTLFLGWILIGASQISAWAADTGAGAPAGAVPAQQGIFGMIVPFAAMFAVIYFLMIKPQQRKVKEQQEMLTQLKAGDEVLTAAGILGKITEITDKVVMVEVADNVRIRVLKSQITQVLKGHVKDLAT